jgi:imidazole glycerol-phosphate synthase subunit HisH
LILNLQLFQGVKENDYVYLVHSYYIPECTETIASTEYGVEYTSAIQKDNFYGVQFHPEKSSSAGELILKNFLNIEQGVTSLQGNVQQQEEGLTK